MNFHRDLYSKVSAMGRGVGCGAYALDHILFNLLSKCTTRGGCRPYGPPLLPQLQAQFISTQLTSTLVCFHTCAYGFINLLGKGNMP